MEVIKYLPVKVFLQKKVFPGASNSSIGEAEAVGFLGGKSCLYFFVSVCLSVIHTVYVAYALCFLMSFYFEMGFPYLFIG